MTISARRPATAADVAARAGVSRATVSHILNGREASFSPGTRERVLRAAGELDYRPSPAGRNLVRGRGDTIVVLASNSTIGQNHQDAIDRVTAGTAGMDVNVVLRFADADDDATATAILRLRPLAVVNLAGLSPAACARLAAQGVPVVPRRDDPPYGGEFPLDQQIAEIQVVELTRRDTRPVIYASLLDRRPDPWSPHRFAAVEHACATHGLEPPISVALPPDRNGAFDALEPLLGQQPVGIAAFNDTVALAALSVARRLGLRVPQDLSVVGVDNTPVGQLIEPRLTTIDVDMDVFIDHAFAHLGDELGTTVEPATKSSAPPLALVRGDSS